MTFAEFLDWWRGQLGELLPVSLRSALHRRQSEIAVSIDGDNLELASKPGKASAALDLSEHPEIGAAPAIRAFLAELAGLPRRVRLSLAPGEFLVRQLALPSAARPHLSETIRYQLPQVTPFSAEDCWFACAENRGASGADTLVVWLLVIPRHKLARVFGAIGLSAPESPWVCDEMPSSDQTLALSWRATDESAPSRRRVRIAWVGMAMLWMVAAMLHVGHKLRVHEQLEQTADTLRVEALEVGRHRDRLAALDTQAAWLMKEQQSAHSTLAMLDLLTRKLDDQTWLQRCEINRQRVTLTGVAPSPASLIGELESLPMLSEVRFETAITRDAGSAGNRFKLSAKMISTTTEDGI